MSAEPVSLIQAIDWFHSARADPAVTRARVEHALSSPSSDRAVTGVLHAIACRVSLDFADATAAVEAAELAVAHDDPSVPARVRTEIRALHSAALSYAGRLDDAAEVLDEAERLLKGPDNGLLDIQRGALLYRIGRLDDARLVLDRALERLPPSSGTDQARAFNNRGVVNLYLGALGEAERDFDAGEVRYRAAGLDMAAADLAHNRGMVYARMGDLPRALRAFEAAEQELSTLAGPIDQQIVARSEILVMAGLAEDVLDIVPKAVERLDAAGMAAPAAEGRLYLAMALRILGEPGAEQAALTALQDFDANGRLGWAAIARDELVQARSTSNEDPGLVLDGAEEAAEALDRHGMHDFAAGAWLRVARVALAGEDPRRAGAALDRVRRRRGSLAVRLAADEASALFHSTSANTLAARRAVLRGLRLLELHRSLFGATELRAQASAWGAGLAELDIRLAWNAGPVRLLRAAERWRAAATRPRLEFTDDPGVDRLLATYRATHGVSALLRHERDGDEASERARQSERQLTAWLRTKPAGSMMATAVASVHVSEIRRRLGGGAFIELVRCGGDVRAIVVTGRRTTVVEIGSATALDRAARDLATTTGRLAGALGTKGEGLLMAATRSSLARLGSLVVEPILRRLPSGGDVVLVPTGELHALPWGVLFGPDRVVSVNPSVHTWLRPWKDGVGSGVVCAAGPGLPGAENEARTLAGLHEGSRLLIGSGATVEAFTKAADGCRLAHVAAHAHFRSVNPLFSHLLLADGPATAHDLETLRRPPALMVLSGCSTGLVGPRAGGDLLGLSTVLLSGGTRALVVSTLPLPDRWTVPVMISLHERLIAGRGIGEAVRATISDDQDSPGGLATACALLCLGDSRATLIS